MTRQATLRRELQARKKELQDAQRRQRDNLQKQIRRAQARVSTSDRKRRTRRLILIGSYMEHVTQSDPDRKARLMKGLDSFLERERDRELFGLVLQKEATPPLFPSPWMISDRSSPSRVRFAASRPGLLRDAPKG